MKKVYIATLSLLISFLLISGGNLFAQSITVLGVPANLCANEAFTIGYSATGINANAGNSYVAELSDNLGGFTSPIVIGSEATQDLDGTIYVIIPESTPFASLYRIRVTATDTDLGLAIGLDNGLNININCITRDYYWINGEGNWSDLSHWEYTTNDIDFFNATVPPTSNDNVNFDDLSFPSGGTLTVDVEAFCNDMYWDASVVTSPQLLAPSSFSINVRGDLEMANGVYKDVYRFRFNSEKKYISIDLADNTTKLNSNTLWDGIFEFNGTGSYDLLDSLHGQDILFYNSDTLYTNDFPIDLTNRFSLQGNSAVYTGSSTIRLAYFSQNGTSDFNSESSTLIFNRGFGSINQNIGILNNVILEAGDIEFYNNDSILNLKLMPDVKLKINPNANVNVTGSFEALGTRSKMIDIKSMTLGMSSMLKLSSASALVNFVILQDNTVTATSAPVSASNSIDNGNNTNWNIATIAPLSYFWIGGTGNWSDINHWATTDGGTTLRTDPPGPVDNVSITSNSFPSGGHLTIDIVANCNDFIWTDGSTSPSIGASFDFPFTVRGDFALPVGVTRNILDLRFESVTNNVLTFSDNQIYTQGDITFDGSGSWSLQDSLSTNTLNVDNGTLNTNNNTLNLSFTLNVFGGMTNMGSSIVNTHYIQGDGLFINAGTSTFIFTDWARLALSNATFNDVIFNGNDCIIFNSHNYENITLNAGANLQIASGTTQNFNQSLSINGTRSNMATLRSDFAGTQAFFTATLGAVVTADYVYLEDNNATGTTFSATNAVDNGNNPGWNISPITPLDYYWISGSGDWSDFANHWSSLDGGSADRADPPGPLDDVFFTGFSSFTSGDTITLDIPASVHDMNWSDGSAKPHLDRGPNFNSLTITGSLFMANGVSKRIGSIYFDSQALGNLIDFKDNLGFVSAIWFKGGGTWTSLDSLSANRINIIDGTFKTNSNDLTSSSIYYYWGDTGLELPILDLGNSVVDVYNIEDWVGTGQLISGGSLIKIQSGGWLTTNGHTYNDVLFEESGFLRGSNTYNSITSQSAGATLELQAASTSTVNISLNLNGEAGAPLIVNSSSPGAQATISMPASASVVADFIHLYDNNATGGATFTATNSAQFPNVTGWTGLLSGQTIDFATTDALFSDGAITLNGATTSGLGLQYTLTQGDASISGDVITPNSAGLVGVIAAQPGDATFGEALSVMRYIHFNATTDVNEIGNMKAASYVVGQADLESNDFFFDVNKTPFARQAFVTKDGKLITSGYRRVLIWNQVPDKADVPADVVVGQPDFISSNFEASQTSVYSSSYSIKVTDDGKLLVGDNRGILIWNTIPTTNGAPADVIIGQDDFNSTESGPGPNRFQSASFFIIAPDGRLIVSDLQGGRVLIFNQIPTTNGASADVVLGQDDFSTIETGDGRAGLNWPSYSAIDASGKFYLPDAQNNRVLVYNSVPTVSGTLPDFVLGQPDFDTNLGDSVINGTTFNFPYSVSISRTGKMAIVERLNNRVLIYNSPPTDNTVEPDFILGQPDAFSNSVGGGSSTINNRGFNTPYAVFWDAAENLYVGDLRNNRYLVWGTPDIDPPTINNTSLPAPYISGSGDKAIVQLNERSGLQKADAMWRLISNPDQTFITAPLLEESENVWSFDLSGIDSQNAPLGVEFYIDVVDGYGNAFETSASTEFVNIGYTDGLPVTKFGVGSATTDYRLFAVPLNLQNKSALVAFDEVFAGTYDKSKMRIFSYAGGTATSFTELGSGFSTLDLGSGYFGLAANGVTVSSGNGQTVPFHNQDLPDGWQLIGNPYNFTLNWSDIESASGFSSAEVQAPRGYISSGYTTGQATIAPGEGVFVLNKTGGTLNIVYPVANNVGGRIMEDEDNANDLSNDSWEVRFISGIGDEERQIGAVGMELDADQSIDKYDLATPPPIGTISSIVFHHPEYFVTAFDRDIKPTSRADNWSFTYSSGDSGDEEQEISWDNSYYGYNTPDLYLVDKTNFEVINMKETSSYQFVSSGETKFQVYFGENAINDLLPDQMEAQTPYPNPFKDMVKINIGLPQAANDYKVIVAIYNTMGKQVTTLVNAEMNGGFHTFKWTGTNDSGQEVADGIYAYRIMTSGGLNNVITGKLIKE